MNKAGPLLVRGVHSVRRRLLDVDHVLVGLIVCDHDVLPLVQINGAVLREVDMILLEQLNAYITHTHTRAPLSRVSK